ncbi:MAG: TonB-dependent receptor [Prevotellaceae bacterium]|nr:TonB-dependent receptor [Prevotellaceae bacterium]
MKTILKSIVLVAFIHPVLLMAQPVGTIRGVVTDGASGQALPYVTVVVLYANPPVVTTTNLEGNFCLNNMPVGRYDIQSSFMGYESVVSKEILVSSGKEVFVEMAMRENIRELQAVTVRPKVNKEALLNLMAIAGGRMLSVEEASRYAGGFDDPARLVTAFAGVSGSTQSNGISIRGNAPLFLQWRIEGVEAVNPTHFSDMTSVGGGILTALSAQVLGNSDFFTGAFPAEYGNALSGVFDMQLRSGNNQRHEHTVQIGTLGVDVASEGPFKKGGTASYLFNYRYSSMALMGDLLPDLVGDAGGMRYQDLSFKMNFPTKKVGTFSLWGIGIIDHYMVKVPKDTLEWSNIAEGEADYRQTKIVGGLGHKVFLNEKSYLKSALVANYTQNQTIMDYVYPDWSRLGALDMINTNWNLAFHSYLNTKFSATHTNRTGIDVTGLFFDLNYWITPTFDQLPPEPLANYAKGKGSSVAFSAFSQSMFRLNNRLTANIGLHAMYLHINGKATIEPRIGIRWQAFRQHTFGLAYGKHSRRDNTDYYFVQTPLTGEEMVNKNLDFAKAHHLVLSYDWSVSEHLRLKVEPYFQYLYDVPVVQGSLTSLINHRDFWLMYALVNDGKGKNWGIDFTLERYLHQGYYYLWTASLFTSQYMGGDGVWRNTRLNRNFILNALGGKEWKMGKQKQNILSLSLRVTLQGGEHYIPIDEAASIASQRIVYDNSRAFQMQLSPEFLGHFTISYKINRNRLAHEISFKMANVTGCEEFGGYYFDYRTNKPEMYLGAVVMPNIGYKIEF